MKIVIEGYDGGFGADLCGNSREIIKALTATLADVMVETVTADTSEEELIDVATKIIYLELTRALKERRNNHAN